MNLNAKLGLTAGCISLVSGGLAIYFALTAGKGDEEEEQQTTQVQAEQENPGAYTVIMGTHENKKVAGVDEKYAAVASTDVLERVFLDNLPEDCKRVIGMPRDNDNITHIIYENYEGDLVGYWRKWRDGSPDQVTKTIFRRPQKKSVDNLIFEEEP